MRRGRWVGWRSDSGQALVEFALVIPLVLLLVVGLADFSRAWNAQQVLTDVAREALRNAVVANPHYTYEDMREHIDRALIRASLDPERAEVWVDGWNGPTGSQARIRIAYQYELGFFGPLAGWSAGERSLALSTSFVMRNE